MEKSVLSACILALICISFKSVYCGCYYKTQPYKQVQEKQTQLHFYLHDMLSGPKPTAVQIARPNTTQEGFGPTPFGFLYAIDDPLTDGPELTPSNVIGNARGMYLASNQDSNLTLILYVDLGFTSGDFKGSSISVFSRNPVTETNRELAVVGGRGQFRLARGYVEVKTYYLNITNGDAILEYKVTVIHP